MLDLCLCTHLLTSNPFLHTALHILPLATLSIHTHAMLPYLILFKSCGKRCAQATDASIECKQKRQQYESINFKVQDCTERKR